MFERLSLLRRRYNYAVEIRSFAPPHSRPGLQKLIGKFGFKHRSLPSSDLFSHLDVEARITYSDALIDPPQNEEAVSSAILADLPPAADFVTLGNLRDPAVRRLTTTILPARSILFLTEAVIPSLDEIRRQPNGGLIAAALGGSVPILVGSRFLQQTLKQAWNVEPAIAVVTIDQSRYRPRVERPRNFISMLHPYRHKGAELVLALADRLKNHRFKLAGGLGEEYRLIKPDILRRPNIEHPQWLPDPISIYESSSLVLVPSICDEAFSRIVIEAFAAGVPVIASDRGGLPEAGGMGAIHLPIELESGSISEHSGALPTEKTVNAWSKAIQRFDEPGYRAERISAGSDRLVRYEDELQSALATIDQLIRQRQ